MRVVDRKTLRSQNFLCRFASSALRFIPRSLPQPDVKPTRVCLGPRNALRHCLCYQRLSAATPKLLHE